jgi:TPP-dependent 2-oxoacid decarboxylase
LLRREPGSKLKLQFVGGKPLTQEQIFKMFRPYGQMRDIIYSETGDGNYLQFHYLLSSKKKEEEEDDDDDDGAVVVD